VARAATALRPIIEAWEWQTVGLCRDRSTTQFFHPDDDLGRISRRLREAAAKRLCLTCPVRAQCATHALTVGEEYGVWGGFTETERARLRDAGWRDTLGENGLVDIDMLERRLGHVTTSVSMGRPRSPQR
jgi:Transcription factor WhiB.